MYGIVAGTVAAVGWMINEIHKDEERQRQRRTRERDEEKPVREDREDPQPCHSTGAMSGAVVRAVRHRVVL